MGTNLPSPHRRGDSQHSEGAMLDLVLFSLVHKRGPLCDTVTSSGLRIGAGSPQPPLRTPCIQGFT